MICLTGCSKKEEKPETINKPQETTNPPGTTPVPTTTTEKKDSAHTITEDKKETKEPEKKELNDKSGAVRIQFPSENSPLTLNGKMKGAGDKITYVFDAAEGNKLYAAILPIDASGKENYEGNIRINQIIRPSGKIDGPFGLKAKYNFQESGNYILVICENNTAGTPPWEGDFILTIQYLK
jgi:hypothetical protein